MTLRKFDFLLLCRMGQCLTFVTLARPAAYLAGVPNLIHLLGYIWANSPYFIRQR